MKCTTCGFSCCACNASPEEISRLREIAYKLRLELTARHAEGEHQDNTRFKIWTAVRGFQDWINSLNQA